MNKDALQAVLAIHALAEAIDRLFPQEAALAALQREQEAGLRQSLDKLTAGYRALDAQFKPSTE